MPFTTTLTKAIQNANKVTMDGAYARVSYPDSAHIGCSGVGTSAVSLFDTNQVVTIADDGTTAVPDITGVVHAFCMFVYRPISVSDIPTPLLPIL